MSNLRKVNSNAEPLKGAFEVKIKSNVDDVTIALETGTGTFQYHESMLSDSVGATLLFGDAIGGSIAFPIIGTEEVNLKLQDNNGVVLKFDSEKNNALYVTEVNPLIKESTKKLTQIFMRSEEYIRNQQGVSTIKNRYDGNISDSVTNILKNKLQTQKPLDIEISMNTYNFIGNNRKPFYIINWLAKKCIPKNFRKGASAGFFFFETSNGFVFKSIDGLFNQKPKKRFVYTSVGSNKIPEGYDAKILQYREDNLLNIGAKLKMGAYQTKLILFDPFNAEYKILTQTASGVTGVRTEDGVKLLGKDLPKLNKKFTFNDTTTRTTYAIKDTGTLPSGSINNQIEKSAEQNFEVDMLLNQAIRRYNQVFSASAEITIAADFSLHAGDIIFIDSPAVLANRADSYDSNTGGLYIITDLCHYITVEESYTKLTLARDSFGRKSSSQT